MRSDRRKYARRTLHRIKRLRISLAPLRDAIAAIVSTEIGRNLKIRRVKVTFKQFCDERRMDDESKYQLRLKFISLSLSYQENVDVVHFLDRSLEMIAYYRVMIKFLFPR